MKMNLDAVYWYKNQAAIMYHSDLPASASPTEIAKKMTSFRQQLNQDVLEVTGFNLLPFSTNNVPQAQQAEAGTVDQMDDLKGVYLFGSPANAAERDQHTDVIVFYQVVPKSTGMARTMPTAESMAGDGGSNGMGNGGAADNTLVVVNQLNNHKEALQTRGASSFEAMPHWFKAGTGDQTHGCPVSPPIPIQDSNAPGRWKITLPEISDPSLQDKTGDGVTVFILDTLPTREQILEAAGKVGSNNMLLRDIAEQIKRGNIKISYQDVADPALTAVTGKDIYGRLVGFPMADHGLFIAGIVHDVAPKAKIECIRVLNDYGVGDLDTLVNTLSGIYYRMLKGDLIGKPMVINLSLVMGPPESDLPRFGWDNDSKKPPLEGVQGLFKRLVKAGAIITASAGNDSDPRDVMNALEERFGPRYPAAFVDDDPVALSAIIPVGAVNQRGIAASYSNYPGPHGIGTYAGELPKPDPWLPSAMSHVVTHVDTTSPIDALRGVYSASEHPALSKNNPNSTYQVPNSNAWVYWPGTSFATPIITALAARVLEGQPFKSVDVREALIKASKKQQTMWTGVGESHEDVPGPMIMVEQDWMSGNTFKS